MDIAILQWIQTWSSPFLNQFFAIYTRLGDHAELWIGIALVLMLNKKTRKIGYFALFALLLELILVSGILKPIVMRVRPFEVANFDILIPVPRGSSFPSGHGASAFAMAGTFFFFIKGKQRWIFLGLAALMAFSRLYVFVHYPSDVLVGSLIGFGIAYILYRNEAKISEYTARTLQSLKK